MLYRKNDLTNEQLKGRFKSLFDLTNFAMDLAKDAILHHDPKGLMGILEELVLLPKMDESE